MSINCCLLYSILMNIKQRNKNIRNNILTIVSNRLKPVNQSLHLCRTSCQSCLIKSKPLHKQQEYQSPIKKSNTNANTYTDVTNNKNQQKQQQCNNHLKLTLCSNLYQLVIMEQVNYENHKHQFKQQTQNTQNILKLQQVIIQKHDMSAQTLQSVTLHDQQQVKSFISQWMGYVVALFSNQIFPTERDVLSLPFQDQEELKNIRKKINNLADQHNSLYKDVFQSSISEMHNSQFKKLTRSPVQFSYSSVKTRADESNERDKQKNKFNYQQGKEKSLLKSTTILRNPKGSFMNLLDSSTIIPSQANITRSQSLMCDQLYRMLLIQSTSIQHLLQNQLL